MSRALRICMSSFSKFSLQYWEILASIVASEVMLKYPSWEECRHFKPNLPSVQFSKISSLFLRTECIPLGIKERNSISVFAAICTQLLFSSTKQPSVVRAELSSLGLPDLTLSSKQKYTHRRPWVAWIPLLTFTNLAFTLNQ